MAKDRTSSYFALSAANNHADLEAAAGLAVDTTDQNPTDPAPPLAVVDGAERETKRLETRRRNKEKRDARLRELHKVAAIGLDAETFLKIWGKVHTGVAFDPAPTTEVERLSGRRRSPFRLPNYFLGVASYVESTPGFARAFPALSHIYGRGLAPEAFVLQEPGERLIHALIRLQWADLCGMPKGEVCARVCLDFMMALHRQFEANPPDLDQLLAMDDEQSEGPVSDNEREQFSLYGAYRRALERKDSDGALKIFERLEQRRAEAREVAVFGREAASA